MFTNKVIASGVVALALFGASVASLPAQAGAQSYYYPSTTGLTGQGCVSISGDLSYGSTGSSVLALQKFLVAQNYPGGGSWMETGYFGQATIAAVRDFQQAHGLPMSGAADPATLAAINAASCGLPAQAGGSYLPGLGSTNYVAPTTYPYNYSSNQYPYSYNQYPYSNNSYPYNYSNCGSYSYAYSCPGSTYGTAPTITSLSPQNPAPGQLITVYGSNFDYANNTVYVGGTTLSGIPSSGGTSLTFSVPTNVTGLVSVTVGNSYGTSNALTLTVGSSAYPCSYSYNCNPYPYPYQTPGYCPQGAAATETSLNPVSGSVGSEVTVFGTCFSATGNSVHFGNGIITGLSSNDGVSLSFAVPTSLSGYGYQPIGLGTYNVSVSNSSGATSNTLPFAITSLNSSGASTISNVSGPTTLPAGQTGTWSLTVNANGNTYSSVSVNWGDNSTYGNAAPQTSYGGTQTFTFTHSYSTNGTYTITFTISNQNGQESSASATVYVSGYVSGGAPTVTYLAPSAAYVGNQMTIYGTDFSSTGNTVQIGSGSISNLTSNGSSISFAVPSFVSIYCATGLVCGQAPVPLEPGTYNLSVMDQYGTSNAVQFTVL